MLVVSTEGWATRQDRERIQQLEELFSSLRVKTIENVTFLLVFRSDYNGLVGDLKLPPLLQDENWKEIPPFTERAARSFVQGSGLKVNDELLHGVLREAAEIEQAKGLIRPVTINLCGLVLGRFVGGIPRGFRPGTLIRGFLREAVTLSVIRDVTPAVLPQLISHSVTKRPRTITEMAQVSGLGKPIIRGCMLVLGQSDRAIVRPLDATQETWEISHDFLVPLLDSIVARWNVSQFWRQARPLVPWLAALALIAASTLSTRHLPSGPQFGRIDRDPRAFAVAHDSVEQSYPACEKDPMCSGVHAFPRSTEVEPILSLATAWGPGSSQVERIRKAGKIVFQSVGSTGNTQSPRDMNIVAATAEADFQEDFGAHSPDPSFLLNLGDVVYDFGERQYYFDQFYSPWRNYPAPIFAVAGNHDGMVLPGSSTRSLQAFLDNFCTNGQPFHRTLEAGSSIRTAQIQPGVYFTLEAPYVRIIILYSNTLEGPGEISSRGGKFREITDAQLQFLEAALTRVKKENFAGAVIIAVHHDPYSGLKLLSSDMLNDLDAVSKKVGVWPHAVLSGHSHNYQRYTRTIDSMQIPYIVVGNGGHGLMRFSRESPPRVPAIMNIIDDHVSLQSYDDKWYGYLRIIVDSKKLRIEYREVSQNAGHLGETESVDISSSGADAVTVDLQTRRLVSP